MYILIIFFTIVILKLLLNILRLLGTYFCYNKFKKQAKNLAQLIPFAESLFNNAKTNMIAYQKSDNANTMSWISHFLTDTSQSESLDLVFNKTIGTYKFRIFQCFNPFYWLFLPKYIFEGINLYPPQILMYLFHLIYWIITIVAAHFLELYLDAHWGSVFQQTIDKLP